jgi:hypothetical protein
MEPVAWALRPTLLFCAAYLLDGVLHEVAHAVAAFCLRIPSVLFQYRVDVRPEDAEPWQHAIIAGAGPVASGGFALLCAWAYRRAAGRPGQLMLLYLAALAAMIMFGNMMSEVGDFARVEDVLDLPRPMRTVMTGIGFLGLVGVLSVAGRELRTWFAKGMSRAAGVLVFIVIPALVGTGLASWLSQPMPQPFTLARYAEGALWIVAAISAWNTRLRPSVEHRPEWNVVDALVAIAAAGAVRVLVPGIIVLP